MSSKQQRSSSGSDTEERKRKRKLSNRESARRSRMRKQQHLDELLAQEKRIGDENKKLSQTIDDTSQLHGDLVSKNNVLRAQAAELTDRLRSLNSVLQIASEVSDLVFDIQDIPDSLLEPWRLPCPMQPIPASTDNFKC
ncbi:bZIP transcription factor 53-like [Primulina tabacum]|uniref:bZIP transcription factor 53-like n=1 Tax=Primulina tabacum TaxID=48773 RepID=UPI003F5919BA